VIWVYTQSPKETGVSVVDSFVISKVCGLKI
jgi:hypothetical protein